MKKEEIKQKIYDLYDECLDNLGQFHRKLDFFIIPAELVQIKIITDLDVSDHWVCIDNYGILHTLEQHGNPISEAKRGQVAIEKEDFFKMLEVFLYSEEIVLIGKASHTQKPILQFVRQIEDKIYVLKEIRTITSKKKNKLSCLVLHTMYKIKASNRTAEVVD